MTINNEVLRIAGKFNLDESDSDCEAVRLAVSVLRAVSSGVILSDDVSVAKLCAHIITLHEAVDTFILDDNEIHKITGW